VSAIPSAWHVGADGRAAFQRAGHEIFNHHVICLAGDGCMQEGVAMEACEFAGHQGLDNLLLIYDSNDVTLDAMADKTQSENTSVALQGDELGRADDRRRQRPGGAPQGHQQGQEGQDRQTAAGSLRARSFAKGIPEVAGTSKGHGEGGASSPTAPAAASRCRGAFLCQRQVRAYFTDHKKRLKRAYGKWKKAFAAWREALPPRPRCSTAPARPRAPRTSWKNPALPG